MPVRHFYLLSHYICYGLFFLFSVFWLHVNEFNSFWGERGRGQKSSSTQKVCLPGIFTCSHIIFAMVYSFYFLCFGSGRNEYNSLWGGIRGRSQKVVAYSDIVSAMLSMMIKWYRKIYHYTWWIYHYIVAIYRFLSVRPVLHDAYLIARIPSLLKLEYATNLKVTTLFFVKWQVLSLYRSLKREKIIFWTIYLPSKQ